MFFDDDEETETMRVCDCSDPATPLIWTFAFSGAEYWCPSCGSTHGMLGAGRSTEATPELKQSAEEWKVKTEKFLEAKSILACYSFERDGKEILRKDLSPEEVAEHQKIVNAYVYET